MLITKLAPFLLLLMLPVRSEGFSLPVRSEGFSLPVRSEGFSLPVRSEGFSLPVRSEGFSLPVRSEGFSLPVRSEGFSLPVRSEGFSLPVRSEGFSLENPNARSQRPEGIRLTVNSNGDENQRDDRLTLREAIAIGNGSLRISDLTAAETSHLSPETLAILRIEFDLPPQQRTIELRQPLPPIVRPGVIIDGLISDRPSIKITPAANAVILRGLTIMADDVTIRGLHLYGFRPKESSLGSTPSAGIFITGHLPERFGAWVPEQALDPFISNEPVDLETVNFPRNISISDNWLGKTDAAQSTFGIWIFNGETIAIERNQIMGHQGSGILSSINAVNVQIQHNRIANNGQSGMPDGIRLQGNITGTIIANNQITGNGGAAIFLFKPTGAVQIRSNEIDSNGQRGSHPGVHLMGRGHEVIDNQISHQNGAGVVVSANPKSDRNRIQGNQFTNLQGLSIDLNTHWGRHSIAPHPYYGDGPNPPRKTSGQRADIGNSGIDAPQFLASEFLIITRDSGVNIDGIAEPDSMVEIYRVECLEPSNAVSLRGPLSEPLAIVQTDRTGRFRFHSNHLKPGDIISATATHPDTGTSEPARNAAIGAI
jgi:hypothetical protein